MSSTSTLEADDLELALLKQLEYYFSRENLAKDVFLVSKMNAELYVPIAVVAGFAKIRKLTADDSLILKVMKQSREIVVDEATMRARPNFSIQRNTIVLRDIPCTATPEQVADLFQGKTSPNIQTIRPEIGNTWFVAFETEAEALKMLDWIRGKTWEGQPISGKLKSESLLKSTVFVESRQAPNSFHFVPFDPYKRPVDGWKPNRHHIPDNRSHRKPPQVYRKRQDSAQPDKAFEQAKRPEPAPTSDPNGLEHLFGQKLKIDQRSRSSRTRKGGRPKVSKSDSKPEDTLSPNPEPSDNKPIIPSYADVLKGESPRSGSVSKS